MADHDDPAVEPVFDLKLPSARDFARVKKLGSQRESLEPWMKDMRRALELVPSMKPVVVHAESDGPAEGGPSREVDGHARNLMLTCMETLQCDKYERIYPTAVALWRGLAGVVRKQSHLNKIESSANLVNLKQAPRESIADLIDRALLYRARLQDVGVNKDDDELLLYIMDALLPSFHFMAKMIKHGGIDGMGHSLEAATDMLVSEEKQQLEAARQVERQVLRLQRDGPLPKRVHQQVEVERGRSPEVRVR
jgi:hypothetical protein